MTLRPGQPGPQPHEHQHEYHVMTITTVDRLAVHRPGAESRARCRALETRGDRAPVRPNADSNDSDGWQDWPPDEGVVG